MADPTLASILPGIAPYLTGPCPDVVQTQQLRSAYGNFCRQTDTYTYKPTAVPTVADQAGYTFTLPDNTFLLRALWLKVDDGAPLDVSGYTVDPDGGIEFETAPSAAGLDITAELVLCPTVSASSMPDWLYERWGEAICNGAIAYLKMIPGRPWTDPDGASYYNGKYRDGIAAAKSERLTARKHGGVVLRPPRAWA